MYVTIFFVNQIVFSYTWCTLSLCGAFFVTSKVSSILNTTLQLIRQLTCHPFPELYDVSYRLLLSIYTTRIPRGLYTLLVLYIFFLLSSIINRKLTATTNIDIIIQNIFISKYLVWSRSTQAWKQCVIIAAELYSLSEFSLNVSFLQKCSFRSVVLYDERYHCNESHVLTETRCSAMHMHIYIYKYKVHYALMRNDESVSEQYIWHQIQWIWFNRY